MIARKDCHYFDECSAPLCPLDQESTQHGLWYPDEEICRRVNMPPWVKRQRQLKDRVKPGTYFTVPMLSHRCKLMTGTVGLNPDYDRAQQEREWFKKHPEFHASKKQMEQARKLGSSVGF